MRGVSEGVMRGARPARELPWGQRLVLGKELTSLTTFTRASAGTHFNSAGVLVSASTDVARFEYDPGNSDALLGFFVEEARTNLCLQSEDFETTWSNNQTVTITANSTVAPDGNTTADTLDDTAGGSFRRMEQSFTVADDNATYTFSFYMLKTTSDSNRAAISFLLTGGTTIRGDITINTHHNKSSASLCLITG